MAGMLSDCYGWSSSRFFGRSTAILQRFLILPLKWFDTNFELA